METWSRETEYDKWQDEDFHFLQLPNTTAMLLLPSYKIEELKQIGCRITRERSSKDTRKHWKKIAGPKKMLVDEVSERERSAEGRAEYEAQDPIH